MNTKKLVLVVLALIVTINLVACGGEIKPVDKELENLDGNIGKVGDIDISKKDFAIVYKSLLSEYVYLYGIDKEEVLASDELNDDGKTFNQYFADLVVDYIVDYKLIEDISDVSINQDEIEGEFINRKNNLGGEEVIEEFLNEGNLTEDEYKEYIRYQLIYGKAMIEYFEKNPVAEDVLRAYYDSRNEDFKLYEASYIFTDKYLYAIDALENVKEGMSLSEAASMESDFINYYNFVDLGYLGKDDLLDEIWKSIDRISGEEVLVEDLIKVKDVGYFIFKVHKVLDDFETLEGDVRYVYEGEEFEEYTKSKLEEVVVSLDYDQVFDLVDKLNK